MQSQFYLSCIEYHDNLFCCTGRDKRRDDAGCVTGDKYILGQLEAPVKSIIGFVSAAQESKIILSSASMRFMPGVMKR